MFIPVILPVLRFLIDGSVMYLRAQVRGAIGKPLSQWFSTLIAIRINSNYLLWCHKATYMTWSFILDIISYYVPFFTIFHVHWASAHP